ncbi:MAG: hypothetical protein LBD46_05210 [Endomicrobium sp.]|jgi:hypothetical protein|nr:hypothetical protein [Endomicrobium sp.]
MFNVEFKRFLDRVINEKQIEAATGKSKSSIYRYAEDPTGEDRSSRGVSMPVDFLIEIVTSNRLKKEKSVVLLKYLCEVCGYELKETAIQENKGTCLQQAKKQAVAHALFSAKNWQALQDDRIDSEDAATLMPLAEEAREEMTKYIAFLRKKINGAKK